MKNTNFELISVPAVAQVFQAYPARIRPVMQSLRELVIDIANYAEGVYQLEESLKWGEPSYRSNIGSTLRMDWKAKNPDQYALYFSCSTKLVPTFKAFFRDTFTCEGNRALLFQLGGPIPQSELEKCIAATLTYHKIKHLPLLGL